MNPHIAGIAEDLRALADGARNAVRTAQDARWAIQMADDPQTVVRAECDRLEAEDNEARFRLALDELIDELVASEDPVRLLSPTTTEPYRNRVTW